MSQDWLELLKTAFGGFAWPWMWLALPLPWLAAWRLPPRRVNSAALRVPYGSRLQAIGASARRSPRRPGVAALAWLAWFLLCAAAARPQQLGEAVAPPQSARDLVLALDLSGSMSEPDMELGGQVVDRLTAAKAVLADFVERRTGDRIGLLVFGQRAYALTPLTLDRDSVRDQLRDSVAGLAGRETAIGDTIALAVKRLREQPKGQRVLILLTDGVNTAGLLDPLKAAELAKAENVRVHTIAFGGAGGAFSLFGLSVPMPGGDDQIDEATLQKIADETGGRAFRARDVEQLAEIYGTLDRIEPVEQPGERVRPRVERYWWPLGAALGVSLLAFLLPRRPR